MKKPKCQFKFRGCLKIATGMYQQKPICTPCCKKIKYIDKSKRLAESEARKKKGRKDLVIHYDSNGRYLCNALNTHNIKIKMTKIKSKVTCIRCNETLSRKKLLIQNVNLG